MYRSLAFQTLLFFFIQDVRIFCILTKRGCRGNLFFAKQNAKLQMLYSVEPPQNTACALCEPAKSVSRRFSFLRRYYIFTKIFDSA